MFLEKYIVNGTCIILKRVITNPRVVRTIEFMVSASFVLRRIFWPIHSTAYFRHEKRRVTVLETRYSDEHIKQFSLFPASPAILVRPICLIKTLCAGVPLCVYVCVCVQTEPNIYCASKFHQSFSTICLQ